MIISMCAESEVNRFSASINPMIIGTVSDDFKAVISLDFYNQFDKPITFHKNYIDTGFNHDVCMPAAEIRLLGLELATNRPMSMELADGNKIDVPVYIGKLKWLDVVQEVLVVAMGNDVLLGMGLLATCKTTIDHRVITME